MNWNLGLSPGREWLHRRLDLDPEQGHRAGLRLRAPRASGNDDLAVETTVIFRLCFRGQRGFYLATDHRRRAQSINMRTAGWATYVLSTVWFSVGDYCRVLLRFARLLSDHLRGCHASEPPRD